MLINIAIVLKIMATDPLSDIIALLNPSAPFSKLVEGVGQWRVRRELDGRPIYCAVLEGSCCVRVEGMPPMVLHAGDFVLSPATQEQVIESVPPPRLNQEDQPFPMAEGHYKVGDKTAKADVRLQIGLCSFETPDASLLITLLPRQVIVRSEPRLGTLMQLVAQESRTERPAREHVISRLLEVLMIEALRAGEENVSQTGLARGLMDGKLAVSLRAIHARPDHRWTVSELAANSAMSRSVYFSRFQKLVGVTPMEYIATWRMAIAKKLLRANRLQLHEIANAVGYGSTTTFGVAFARHVGVTPRRYALASHQSNG